MTGGPPPAQGPSGRQAGLTSTDFTRENAWYRRTLANLLGWLAEGKLSPVVAERVPVVEAAHAHELLERGRYAGKVVLVPGA